MIKIICGPKGTGKTKQLIDAANAGAKNAQGYSVFITDTKRYAYDVAREVRFIDVTEYHVAGEDALLGFVKGVMAANGDNEKIYIDGLARIAGKNLNEMATTFYMLEQLSGNSVTVTITCSCDKDELPPFVAKYL